MLYRSICRVSSHILLNPLPPTHSDPVAYRIEPLLLPEGVDNSEFPKPLFLSPDGKGVRVHVKVRQGADALFRGLGSFGAMFDKSAEHAATQAAAADEEARKVAAASDGGKEKPQDGKPNFSGCIRGRECIFALGGESTRVDFQMQPGIIDNEYLSAVSAHSNYFVNEDLVDFLIFNTKPETDKE